MIEITKSIIALVAVELAIPIIRKDQGGKMPSGNFAAYKVMSVNGEKWNSKRVIDNPDPLKITERYSKTSVAVVSLSFYSLTSIADIHTLAEKAVDFLQVKGREQLDHLNVIVDLDNGNITDRTTYIEPIYEYQIGFDFKIMLRKELNVELHTLDLPLSINDATNEIL